VYVPEAPQAGPQVDPAGRRAAMTGSTSRPLIVTADTDLRDALLRLTAAAGADSLVVDGAAAARACWSTAPIVVVGEDIAAQLAQATLPRRGAVLVVGAGEADVRRYAAGLALGAEDVLALPAAEPVLVRLLGDAIDGAEDTARVIGVIGGRGGAGATTLAVALAVFAPRQGLRTMLVDADPLGGGIDLALGAEHARGLRWGDLAHASGRVSASALHESLVRAHDLTVLSWGRADGPGLPAAAVQSALQAGCRQHDLVVVDLPRWLDDAARVAVERADAVLLVVPAEVRAAAAARRVAASVGLLAADVRVVVRGPAAAGLSPHAIASSLGLPLAGELRADPNVAAALDRGEPPAGRGRGPLARFAAHFVETVLADLRPAA
jgi:secretion/DNA translocation related CpaE-like protein